MSKRFWDIVCVGAGHSNLLAILEIRRLRPKTSIALISAKNDYIYSGMVPAYLVGAAPSPVINIKNFCSHHAVHFVRSEALKIIPEANTVITGEGRFYFRVCSLNLGGQRKELLESSGSTLFARPISSMLEKVRNLNPGCKLSVIGAGAAGTELAVALRAQGHQVSLIGPIKPSWKKIVARNFQQQGIEIIDSRVSRVQGHQVFDGNGSIVHESDYQLVCTGATEKQLVGDGGPGVLMTLQSQSNPHVFRSGDCAAFPRPVPKPGVYAVRQAPTLAWNLLGVLTGEARHLKKFRPPRDPLQLIYVTPDKVMLSYKGLCFEGRVNRKLKTWIDTRFMRSLEAS